MPVAVIFTSQRLLDDNGRAVDDKAYQAANAEMMELVRHQPGFLGVTSARDSTGLGITVSYWTTAADARAWGRVAAHRAVQTRGRKDWYAWYRVERADVTSEWAHRAASGTSAG